MAATAVATMDRERIPMTSIAAIFGFITATLCAGQSLTDMDLFYT
jgi:hypothetical protein